MFKNTEVCDIYEAHFYSCSRRSPLSNATVLLVNVSNLGDVLYSWLWYPSIHYASVKCHNCCHGINILTSARFPVQIALAEQYYYSSM